MDAVPEPYCKSAELNVGIHAIQNPSLGIKSIKDANKPRKNGKGTPGSTKASHRPVQH